MAKKKSPAQEQTNDKPVVEEKTYSVMVDGMVVQMDSKSACVLDDNGEVLAAFKPNHLGWFLATTNARHFAYEMGKLQQYG